MHEGFKKDLDEKTQNPLVSKFWVPAFLYSKEGFPPLRIDHSRGKEKHFQISYMESFVICYFMTELFLSPYFQSIIFSFWPPIKLCSEPAALPSSLPQSPLHGFLESSSSRKPPNRISDVNFVHSDCTMAASFPSESIPDETSNAPKWVSAWITQGEVVNLQP